MSLDRKLVAVREVKIYYSFPPLPGQYSGSGWTDHCCCRICRFVCLGWGGGRLDWLWINLLIVLILVLGRYVLQAVKHVEPQVKQVFQSLPKSVRLFLLNVLPVSQDWNCPIA